MHLILLLAPLAATVFAKNTFVSAPFDNFRIECPKKGAAVELHLRMMESVGAKRQDIVFEMGCEMVNELYPWVNIPVGVSDIEREDCHYSAMLDPILDDDTGFTCKSREYVAGVTRLTDTRVQVMCCRLRSRDEFNCQETVFNKPLGPTRSTIIEHENQLINAIKVTEQGYTVRFCDLAPRNIADIFDDVKKRKKVAKTAEPTKAPRVPSIESSSPSVAAEQTTRDSELLTDQVEMIPETTTIRAKASKTTMSTTTESPTTTEELPETIEEVVTSTRRVMTTRKATTTRRTTTPSTTTTSEASTTEEVQEKEENHTTDPVPTSSHEKIMEIIKNIESEPNQEKADELFKESVAALLKNKPNKAQRKSKMENDNNSKTVEDTEQNNGKKTTQKVREPSQAPRETVSTEDEATVVDDLSRVTFHNEEFPKFDEKKASLSNKVKYNKNNLPLRPGNAPKTQDFVFLKPINAGGHRRAPIRAFRPHIQLWSSEEDDDEEQQTTTTTEATTEAAQEVTEPMEIPKKKPVKSNRASRMSAETTSSAETTEATTTEVTTMTEEVEITEEPTTTEILETVEQYLTDATSVEPTTTSEEPINEVGAELIPNDNEMAVEGEEEMSTAAPQDHEDGQEGETEGPINAEDTEKATAETEPKDLSHLKDLPIGLRARQDGDNFVQQPDNARFVDEDVQQSPFEDEQQGARPATRKSGATAFGSLEFHESDDIEDVIAKLTAKARPDIRRAPVRNASPSENLGEKGSDAAFDSDKDGIASRNFMKNFMRKDGVKTSKSMEAMPISAANMFVPMHTSFDDAAAESLVPLSSPHSTQDDESDEQEKEVEEAGKVSAATTTEYDPSIFYHTPEPKPPKKESILTFCTKEIAIRDKFNMVIACGGETDIWKPFRCPSGSDCFLSHDSTYRICCPVSQG